MDRNEMPIFTSSEDVWQVTEKAVDGVGFPGSDDEGGARQHEYKRWC